MTLVVEAAGTLSLVEDLGRPGMGHVGVGPSGAFDRAAARRANRLLGNDPGDAVVETFGGLVLLAESAHTVVVTGASGPITVDGRPVAYGRAMRVPAGRRLAVGAPTVGLRSYVGLAGGLATPRVLGSRSTDTLAGLGPRPLAVGHRLEAGAHRTVPALDDLLPLDRGGDVTLDVVLGPRDDWFTPEAVSTFLTAAWRVSAASSRIGVRLDGDPLPRAVTRELPSEPCVRGSVQVAADGRPIVLGPDHPVTGGYPVVAVVVDAHTDRLAQVRAGQVVRFARVT
ncbi:biotin-dependent carboxyltransferase family protein [Aeromicrobium sp. CFBP 8757]|uniref:5-oxoprolinase subunit C family protein n=1 Tax=Aeromicrobium sp. CFBP 8757 TaxID=2775288 RepID=UPI00177D5215|nr:biotin-dependent carboxyltransferase family protein [Aeromicrobium sp. CFBP 8757]MBD8607182.1 biotin-dependent carboxyltransferase family protein [Aeromicrobium sp. CFBP 8757]